MNNFNNDLQYSLDISRNTTFDTFYRDIWEVKAIEYMEFEGHKEEQLQGIDKRILLNSGKWITIDEKVRRKDYGDIFLEVVSNTKTNKQGWLFYCKADYIVYYIEPQRKAYLLPTDLLRMAWKEHKRDWIQQYKIREAPNKGYSSKGICVPIPILLNSIARQMRKDY